MSAAAKVVLLLVALVAMALAGRKPADVAADLAGMAGDYWPHLQPVLLDLDRAAALLPDVATHRKWFAALAAELTKEKPDGRTPAQRKPASKGKAAAAAGKGGATAGRARRG